MRYLPTINLWAPGMITALQNGQLKLQPGQWVTCGRTDHKSRYAGITPGGTIYAAHWQGNGADTRKRFHTLLEALGNQRK